VELTIVPSKKLLKALAVDITPYDAITDLVDNSWDSWVASDRPKKLEIRVTIEPNQDRIRIGDNAGGIRFKELDLLFAPGGSSRAGEPDIFGLYGVGAKRAFFSLANEVLIETRHSGEEGHRISISDKWFENDVGAGRWNVPYTVDNSIPPGTTSIVLTRLKNSWTQAEVDVARNRLQEAYGDLLRNRSMRVEFNGKDVDPPERILWAKSKNVPPTILRTSLKVPNSSRKVRFELTVGITVDTWPLSDIGFDVICNGRLIVAHVADYRLGFEEGRLGAAHFTLNRFRGIIRLDGEPRDIPWNSAKNDLNLNHVLYREILGLAVQISKPFTKFLRKNYALSSGLFSQKATDKDFRVIELKPGVELPVLAKPLVREERPPFVRFQVTWEELERVSAFIGYQDRRPGDIGRYVWDYFMEEVMARG
jgi:hypothetical protein